MVHFPVTLLLGHPFRVQYSTLHPVTGDIRSVQTPWLLSGDAFSVIKAERHPNMELQLFHLKKWAKGRTPISIKLEHCAIAIRNSFLYAFNK